MPLDEEAARAEEDRARFLEDPFSTEAGRFAEEQRVEELIARLDAAQRAQAAAIANPFGAFGLSLLGGGEFGQITPQTGQDATQALPALGQVGFSVPQGATAGQATPFTQLFGQQGGGGVPTQGFLNQNPDAAGVIGAVGGFTGTSPEQQQQIARGVTPTAGGFATPTTRRIPRQRARGR